MGSRKTIEIDFWDHKDHLIGTGKYIKVKRKSWWEYDDGKEKRAFRTQSLMIKSIPHQYIKRFYEQIG